MSTSYLHFHFLKTSKEISQTLVFHQIVKFKNVFKILSNNTVSMKLYSKRSPFTRNSRKIKLIFQKQIQVPFVCCLASLTSTVIMKPNSFGSSHLYAGKIKSKPNYTSKQHVYTRLRIVEWV